MNPLTSATLAGGRHTVPQRVILRRSNANGEWTTRLENPETGQQWSGNYFCPNHNNGGEEGAYVRALRDYCRRCAMMKLDPNLQDAGSYLEQARGEAASLLRAELKRQAKQITDTDPASRIKITRQYAPNCGTWVAVQVEVRP